VHRLSPELVLAAARSGDPSAVEQIIATHRLGVYRYGLKVCRTTEDAEDAVQETLWAATRAIGSFRGTASAFASWLFSIVRRECWRLIERHKRSPSSIESVDDDRLAQLDDATDDVAHREQLAALSAAIAELDPIHRETILLRDIEGRSAPEAAAHLGISVPALKSRLHRARADLRARVLRRTRS
jgi:RNA polymerase sigma factor (sigma-70 family)